KKRTPGKPQEHTAQNEEPSIELSDWLQEILHPKVDQPSPHRQDRPIQPVVQTRQPIAVIPEKYQPEKYQQVRYQPSEVPVDLLNEYRNLPEKQEMEEVKKAKRLRLAHQKELRRLHSLEVAEHEGHVNDIPEFNFRDAVIMNAILERPYQ